MSKNKYDFGGWATKYNVACSDGRTILNGAFKHCDENVVPLVWNHTYTGPESIIGKATLVHKDEGVYAYCEFNENPTAETAKGLVKHGDITSLSIYANHLKQSGVYVKHGEIKEVSLVLAGANPGASIQEVLVHGEVDESEATIYNDPEGIELFHADEDNDDEVSNETVADVYDTLSDKQKKAVALIIDQLADETSENNEEDNKGDQDMKHNVFDQNKDQGSELKHFDFAAAMTDAKRLGSLKSSVLEHADNYGIKEIETLFPEAKDIYNKPEFIKRDTGWVASFLGGTHKTPFSRIKAMYADVTADPARALGYVKGNLKKEEVFSLLKRTTEPTTIYKKQKLDRDDIIDITSFDVVAWIKYEMRFMLEEELARAILIGDGRQTSSDDKISETKIRPIYNDSDLYTIKAAISTTGDEAKEFIKAAIKSRAEYEGTGTPNLYTTESMLADMLLLEDNNGRFIYDNPATLAKTLRVKEIITVPVMKDLTRVSGGKTYDVKGVVVNPNDYFVGADKGGQVSMFDDFDIDYNQQKYLIETRCSGALVRPKTAITLEKVRA